MNRFNDCKTRKELKEHLSEWFNMPGQRQALLDAYDLGHEHGRKKINMVSTDMFGRKKEINNVSI
jgi:hypothetical protein